MKDSTGRDEIIEGSIEHVLVSWIASAVDLGAKFNGYLFPGYERDAAEGIVRSLAERGYRITPSMPPESTDCPPVSPRSDEQGSSGTDRRSDESGGATAIRLLHRDLYAPTPLPPPPPTQTTAEVLADLQARLIRRRERVHSLVTSGALNPARQRGLRCEMDGLNHSIALLDEAQQ